MPAESKAGNRVTWNHFLLYVTHWRFGQRGLLACYFASFRPRALPVRIYAPRPSPVGPGPTAASLHNSRCSTCVRFDWLHSRFTTPLWDLYIPQDQSQNRLGRHSARLPDPPDSLSLPGTAPIASFTTGSTFLGRYVFGDLLFLKPLGTFFTMRAKAFFVKRISGLKFFFQQHL